MFSVNHKKFSVHEGFAGLVFAPVEEKEKKEKERKEKKNPLGVVIASFVTELR